MPLRRMAAKNPCGCSGVKAGAGAGASCAASGAGASGPVAPVAPGPGAELCVSMARSSRPERPANIGCHPDPTLIPAARTPERPPGTARGDRPACDDRGVTTPGPAPAPAPVPWPERKRLPLVRPDRGRWVGGVCAGLAAHLDVPVPVVRLVMVALAALGGAGVALYVFWWVTVPSGDPALAAEQARPAAMTRLAPRLRSGDRRVPVTDVAAGLLLLVGAGLLIAGRAGADLRLSWLVPTLILLGGAALAWSQLDAAQRGEWLSRAGGRTPVSVVRLFGGMVLVGTGVLLLLAQDADLSALLRSAVAAGAVLVGIALVLAPWWVRLVRELGDERAARAREAERADIAAHLHDSVLQTLALIRARADEPGRSRGWRARRSVSCASGSTTTAARRARRSRPRCARSSRRSRTPGPAPAAARSRSSSSSSATAC